jgi:hypothetical protein
LSIQRALLDKVYDIGHKLTSINRVPFEKLREREQFRSSLPEPADYLERSFFQYLCQYHEHPNLRGALNVLCVPIAIYLAARLLIFRMSATVCRKDCGLQVAAPSRIIGIMDASVDILPSAILRTEEKIPIYPIRGDIKFDAVAGEIAEKMLKRYWNEPHFVSKCVLRVLRYAALKAEMDCDVIVASAEYSFASSVATDYCGSRGIRHVNVMHGEKILNPVDSFCSFHDFYVWHEHYINLFREMRGFAERFIVSMPTSWQHLKGVGQREEVAYDLTYYLGWELSGEDLTSILETLRSLKESGLVVCVRMHPRYGSRTIIRNTFEGFNIEDPTDVSLPESLRKTACVVSLFTTVFWEAMSARRDIVIDDMSNPYFYNTLKDVRYLWVSGKHALLSKRFVH